MISSGMNERTIQPYTELTTSADSNVMKNTWCYNKTTIYILLQIMHLLQSLLIQIELDDEASVPLAE